CMKQCPAATPKCMKKMDGKGPHGRCLKKQGKGKGFRCMKQCPAATPKCMKKMDGKGPHGRCLKKQGKAPRFMKQCPHAAPKCMKAKRACKCAPVAQ
ncbi:MAG: hypothetical protein Q4F99_01020, partial [bacterium]|nr:hypothetical protein [bacterium]